MIASLVLATTITLATPNPIYVKPGEVLNVEVDLSPLHLIYGGHVRAENTAIATVDGAIAPRESRTTAVIRGIRVGSTAVRLSFVSGLSVYDYVVAQVIVDTCDVPAVTLASPRLRVGEQQPVALQAMTSGAPQPDVHWYDGNVFLGIGNPLTVRFDRGMHRVIAYGVSRCGMAVSEQEIEVLGDRQRAVRH